MSERLDAGEIARERSVRLWLGIANTLPAGGPAQVGAADPDSALPLVASPLAPGHAAVVPAAATALAPASSVGTGAQGHAAATRAPDGLAGAPVQGSSSGPAGPLAQHAAANPSDGAGGASPVLSAPKVGAPVAAPEHAPPPASATAGSTPASASAPAASANAAATPPSGSLSELTFISGITSTGTVGSTSYWTWNHDKPATYSSNSYASKWGNPTPGTPGGTVRYWFDAASNWTTTEKNGFVSGLSLWSSEANISFALASSANAADVTFVRGDDGSAVTSGPPGTTSVGSNTEGTLGKTTITIDTSANGFGPIGAAFNRFAGYPYDTLVHEEGHMIGFGHGGPYNNGDGLGTVPSRQYGIYDSRLWTIMSYIDPTDNTATYYNSYTVKGTVWPYQHDPVQGQNWQPAPETPMILDILAAQRLYGAPTSGPLTSGGTVFGFNCNISGSSSDSTIRRYFDFTINTAPIVTIWDAGTGNTLDLSGYSTNETIDLAPGTFSSCAGFTNNIAIAEGTVISTAVAGSGTNTIIGSGADDTLKGGSGNDTFMPAAGDDAINGGGGTNTVSYANSSAAVLASLASGTGSGGDADGDTYTNIQNLTGSAYADTLVGDDNANTLLGGGGDDLLKGGGGADHLDGGAGNNTASYLNSPSAVTVSLLTGTGSGGEAQGDTLVNIQNLIGSNYDDTLIGDGNANDLSGGGGNDTLIGGGGADTLEGGAGNNTASYITAPSAVIASLASGTGSLGDADGDTYTDIQNLTGSNYDDILIGDGNANTLLGEGGDDTLKGGGGADHLDGGAGNNTASYINSSAGVTVSLLSGTGSGGEAQGDTLVNIQNLTGSDENDILIGDGNANTLYGEDGDDTLKGGGGADHLDGGAGNNTASYYGSPAGVTVSLLTGTGTGGDAQGDTLANIQNLTGSGYADTLIGNSGANILSGGDGNDIINGDGGADSIDGGAGFDIAVFGVYTTSATVMKTNATTITVATGGATSTLTNIEEIGFRDLAMLFGSTVLASGSTLYNLEVMAGGTIEDDGALVIGTTTPILEAGPITGSGGFTVMSGANVTITSADTYTGTTLVQGTLAIGAGGSIAGTSQVTLSTSGATFGIANASAAVTIKSLSLSSGGSILLGGMTLTVTGAVTMTGGLVTSPGSGVLATQGAVAVSAVTLGGAATWRNTGTVTQSGTVQVGNTAGLAATVSNITGGTYNLAGDVGITTGGSTNSGFNNSGGTLAKTAGSGVSTVAVSFQDSAVTAAAVKVASGTLQLMGPSNTIVAQTISGAGTFSIGGGTTIIAGGTSITTSAFSITGGTVTLTTSLSYGGTFSTTSGASVTLGGNTLTLSGTATVGGTVSGTGTLGVTGSLDVTGSIGSNAVVELGAGGSVQFDASQSGATVAFGVGAKTVTVTGSATLGDTLSGFTVGETVDLAGLAFSTAYETVFTASASGGTLKIVDTAHSGAVVATLAFSGNYSGGLFTLAKDASTGTALGFATTPPLGLVANSVETANIPGSAALAIIDQFNGDNSLNREATLTVASGNYKFHYASGSYFTGKPYASYDDVVTPAGMLVSETQYNANTTIYLQETVTTLANGNITYHFQNGSFFTGKSFAAFDNVTNASGTLLTQTLYNASGATIQQTQFNPNGSILLQDTVSTLANGNIDYHYQNGSFFTGKSFASFDNVTNASGTLLTQTLYDSSGATIQQTQFNANGSIYLQDNVSRPAAGQVLYQYVAGSFFSGKAFSAFDNLATTANTLLSQELYNNDGSHSFTVPGSNLTLTAAKNDTFSVTGSNETTRFNATGFGADLFKGYTAGDIFSFSTAIFANYSAMSQHVTGTSSAVITDAANDTLTLNNVAASSLTSAMFKFA